MRSLPRIATFVLFGLALTLPVFGADDKNKKADVKKPDAKKDKDADSEKPKPTEKWLKFQTVAGKVKGVVEAKRSLRIELRLSKDKTVDVEWKSIDDVKVRTLNPPPQFDEKGNFKKYTRKELRELKGNDKTPGYPAEFSDLKVGQIVQISLVKKKGVPRRVKGTDPDLLDDNLPRMSLIMIYAQPKP